MDKVRRFPFLFEIHSCRRLPWSNGEVALLFHVAGLPAIKTFQIHNLLCSESFHGCNFSSMLNGANVSTDFHKIHNRSGFSNWSITFWQSSLAFSNANYFSNICCSLASLMRFSTESLSFPRNWAYSPMALEIFWQKIHQIEHWQPLPRNARQPPLSNIPWVGQYSVIEPLPQP